MTPISFFVQGDPKGQPRARAFARKVGNTFIARVYEAGTAEGWKSQIAEAAKSFLPPIPIEGPLEVSIRFYFRRPKAHFTKKGLRPQAPFWHTSKPDRDNLEKAALDSLKIIGMFKDDCQVCAGPVEKYYANGRIGAEITIQEAQQPAGTKNEWAEVLASVPCQVEYPHHD